MDEAERLLADQLQGMKHLAAMGHPRAEAMLADRDRVLADHGSVSDQIRALDRRGYSRADIARLLGKRYQHVRNVLEEDKLRAATPASSPPNSRSERKVQGGQTGGEPDISVLGDTVRLRVRPDGSVLLSPEVLERLEAKIGGVIVGEIREGELLLRGPQAAIRHVQSMFSPWKPGDPSLVDELIADRREENRREIEGG